MFCFLVRMPVASRAGCAGSVRSGHVFPRVSAGSGSRLPATTVATVPAMIGQTMAMQVKITGAFFLL